MVCLSVCLSVTLCPAKTAEPIKMPFGLHPRMGPGNHDGVPDSLMGRGNFEGASHCKVYRHSAVISAKTAEPIEVPFGLWAAMGPRNCLLDESPQLLRDVTMAANFGTQFAITVVWLSMGYNFGCMIASDTLFDSRGGFLGSSCPMKT